MDGSSNINEIIINDKNKFDYFHEKIIDSIIFSGKSYKKSLIRLVTKIKNV